MTEKVKLPKAVCDALDYAKLLLTSSTIVSRTNMKAWTNKNVLILNLQDSDKIMRGLEHGYEPELTPEEQLKFMLTKKHDKNIDYKSGAWYALKIHGIKYDWLEEYAE